MITGQEKPDGGSLRIGETVKLAYVDQSRDSLKGDNTVYEEISQGAEFLEVGKRKIPARAHVAESPRQHGWCGLFWGADGPEYREGGAKPPGRTRAPTTLRTSVSANVRSKPPCRGHHHQQDHPLARLRGSDGRVTSRSVSSSNPVLSDSSGAARLAPNPVLYHLPTLTEYVLVPLKLTILGRKRIPENGIFWKSVLARTGQPADMVCKDCRATMTGSES